MIARARQRLPWGALLVQLVLWTGGLALVWTQRYRLGLDGVSYLSIAQRWADGEVVRNAYWGPLTSWLAVPWLWVGLPPVVAGHLGMLTAASAAVAGVRQVAASLVDDPGAATDAALVALPLALGAISYGVFPDLVVAAVVVWLLWLLLGRWWDRPLVAAAAGALVGAALLAKAVGLAIALGLVATAVLLAVVTPTRQDEGGRPTVAVARAAVVLATVAAGLLGGWAVVLSAAAGGPVLTSAPGYNLELLQPGVPGAPVLVGGLHEPPSPAATSPWEDPAAYPITVDVRVDASRGDERDGGLARRMVDNLGEVIGHLPDLLPLPLGLAGLAVGLASARGGGAADVVQRRRLLLVLAGALGSVAVVVASIVEVRYLWPAAVLAAPGVALLLVRVPTGWRRALVTTALVVAVAAPLVPGVVLRAGAGEETRATARRLADLGLGDERVASDNRFQRSALVCLHVGCTYLGVTPDDERARAAQLDELGVAWLLRWQPAAGSPPTGAEEVGVFGELVLYRLPVQGKDSRAGGG